jgi:NAD(P)-dependent dehydrogenase (short-subunit alcohol dehydrogenase family)
MTDTTLAGRTALVTGAARGIGAAIAARFAEAGAVVFVADVLEAEGTATADSIRARGGDARFVHLDVTDEQSWEAATFEAIAATDRFDVLVNNAGVEETTFIADTDLAAFRRLMDVNIAGVCLGMKHAFHAMRPLGPAGRGGSIVNVCSVAAQTAIPATGPYAATKAAVERLTKVAAVEAGRLGYGVRVNCVYPGYVGTELSARAAAKAVAMGLFPDRESFDAFLIGSTPMGRLGAVDDVAQAVGFLCSDGAGFITGAGLPVSGGMGLC